MKKLKKKVALVMAAVMAVSMISVPENAQAAKGKTAKKVMLNKKKVTLTVKKKCVLNLKNYKGKKKVSWKVDKKKILKITVKGKAKAQITAKKQGKAKVTAKAGKKKYVCQVIVKKKASKPKTTNAPAATSPPTSSAAVSVITAQPSIVPVPSASSMPVTTSPVSAAPSMEPGQTGEPTMMPERTPEVKPTPVATVDVTETNRSHSLLLGASSNSDKVQGVSVFSKSNLHLIEVFGDFRDMKEVRESIQLDSLREGAQILSEEYCAEAYFSDSTPGYYRIEITGVIDGKETIQTYFMGRAGVFQYAQRDDGTLMIKNYEGWGDHLVVPDTLDGRKVSGCGKESFYHKQINDIVLGSDVVELKERAFYKAQMESAELPANLQIIGKESFRSCENLSIMNMPKYVGKVGESAFYRTPWLSLQQVQENGLCIVGNVLVSGSGAVGDLVIPSGVSCISDGAFEYNEGISSVVIPDSVTAVPKYSFYNCTSLSAITVPDSVNSFGRGAFWKTPWLSERQDLAQGGLVVINHILIDGEKAEGNVTIGDDVVEIADGAFLLSGLTGIQGMKNVHRIGVGAFRATGLEGSLNLPDGLTEIGDNAFCETGVESVIIPAGVKVGKNAFMDCEFLREAVIQQGVIQLPEGTFYGCSSLAEIEIPDSVKSIGDYAFYRCDNLRSVTIQGSETILMDRSFYRCYNEELVFHVKADSTALEYAKNRDIAYDVQ